MRYIDLTHNICSNMPGYPGNPPVEIEQIASHEQDGYADYLIKMNMHTGTHIDAPYHMIAEGKKISEIPLEKLTGRARVLVAGRRNEITDDLLNDFKINENEILLIYTGHSSLWNSEDYFDTFPIITEEFARKIITLKIKSLGIDSPSPDKNPHPVHLLLLSNEIPILENLCNLEQLLGINHIEIITLPLKLHTDSAPARVIARILD